MNTATTKRKVGELEKQIRHCLEQLPETRNSDIELTKAVWLNFYSGHLGIITGEGWAIPIDRLDQVPREDHIKRIRAKIQNEQHEFPPTTWKVAKGRGFEERVWRRLLGYDTEQQQLQW